MNKGAIMENRWYIDYKKPVQEKQAVKRRKKNESYLTNDDVRIANIMFFAVGMWVGLIIMMEIYLKLMG